MNSDQLFLKALGNRIRELRLTRHMSQEELGFQSKLHRTYIGSVERGERNISIINLRRICIALDIPLTELFDSSLCEDDLDDSKSQEQGGNLSG